MEKIKSELKKLKMQLTESLKRGEIASFFDWECPPRQSRKNKDGSIWFDLDLDLEKVTAGRKLDQFTELPKIITRKTETELILKTINREFGQPTLIKLVADTNWLYLYPESLKRIGRPRLREISERFEKLLQKKSNQLYGRGRIKMINFTKLQGKFKNEYEQAFAEVLVNFRRIVPEKIKTQWETRLTSHIGLTEEQREERKNLSKRVIASYAAEGIAFDLLDKSGKLPNPVWVSLDEPSFAGETTEILRKRKGLPPLKKLFFGP